MMADQRQHRQQQVPSVNGALDAAVVNKILSMKSTDLVKMLKAFESAPPNEEEDDIDVQIQGAPEANDTGVPALGSELLGDERPVVNLIDRRNSNSFARLFSMKNMDFKALLESQGLDSTGLNPAPPAQGQEVRDPPGVEVEAGSKEQVSKMRSGDLLDWIWTLDEDNLDAILNETDNLNPAATPQAGAAPAENAVTTDYSNVNRLFSQDPMPPPPIPNDLNVKGLKRKVSDVYARAGDGAGLGNNQPLATNQVALMLQHQAFLAKRQEEQQQQPTSAHPPARRESIGTKTALSLFEELLEDQQNQMRRSTHAPLASDDPAHTSGALTGSMSFGRDGLVGSLAVALGNKTHSSVFAKRTTNASEGPSTSVATDSTTGGKRRKTGTTKQDAGSDDVDDGDPVALQQQQRRRERRAKNKESAAKSRAKKRNYTQGLELIVENLKNENEQLRQTYMQLLGKKEEEARAAEALAAGKEAIAAANATNTGSFNGTDVTPEPPELSEKRRKLVLHYFSLPKNFSL